MLNAIHRAGIRGAAHGLRLQHLLMRSRERVDIHSALVVGYLALEHARVLSIAGDGQRHNRRSAPNRRSIHTYSSRLAHSSRPAQGSTVNFMCMPSWSSLQITVQTTMYSPGSAGAVSWNSCLPGLNNRSHPSTLVRSLARKRLKPWIDPSRFHVLPRRAVTRRSTCPPAFTVISGVRSPAIL